MFAGNYNYLNNFSAKGDRRRRKSYRKGSKKRRTVSRKGNKKRSTKRSGTRRRRRR